MTDRMSQLPRMLVLVSIAGLSLGFGLALGAGYLWKQWSAPVKWAMTPITATFTKANDWDVVDDKGIPIGSGHFELEYVLANHTEADYRITQPDSVTIMAKRDGSYVAVTDASLNLPLFIPSKHSVVVRLNVPYSGILDRAPAQAAGESRAAVPGLDTTSSALLRHKLGDTSGFAIFDSTMKYRIDLPRS